jgi:hypothetical protein
MIARPRKSAVHQAVSRYYQPSASIPPHDGVVGGTPMLRNERRGLSTIARAIPNVRARLPPTRRSAADASRSRAVVAPAASAAARIRVRAGSSSRPARRAHTAPMRSAQSRRSPSMAPGADQGDRQQHQRERERHVGDARDDPSTPLRRSRRGLPPVTPIVGPIATTERPTITETREPSGLQPANAPGRFRTSTPWRPATARSTARAARSFSILPSGTAHHDTPAALQMFGRARHSRGLSISSRARTPFSGHHFSATPLS